MNTIKGFMFEYAFLSNFYETFIIYEGLLYPSSEHAYQAAKTLDINERIYISNLPTPGQAKRAGQKLTLREDWDKIKLDVMYDIVKIKFSNPHLKSLLLQTFDDIIEEENTWGDTYWGICRGVGQNHLGKILMRVRDEIKQTTN